MNINDVTESVLFFKARCFNCFWEYNLSYMVIYKYLPCCSEIAKFPFFPSCFVLCIYFLQLLLEVYKLNIPAMLPLCVSRAGGTAAKRQLCSFCHTILAVYACTLCSCKFKFKVKHTSIFYSVTPCRLRLRLAERFGSL